MGQAAPVAPGPSYGPLIGYLGRSVVFPPARDPGSRTAHRCRSWPWRTWESALPHGQSSGFLRLVAPCR